MNARLSYKIYFELEQRASSRIVKYKLSKILVIAESKQIIEAAL